MGWVSAEREADVLEPTGESTEAAQGAAAPSAVVAPREQAGVLAVADQ